MAKARCRQAVEDVTVPGVGGNRRAVGADRARFGWQQAGQTLEERRLAGTVRPDQSEDLTVAYRKGYPVERDHSPVMFRQTGDVKAHVGFTLRRRSGYYQMS